MRRVLALLAAVAFVLVLVRPSGASSDANNYHWTEVGDSKTAGGCWQSQLNTKLVTRFGAATETPTRLATGAHGDPPYYTYYAWNYVIRFLCAQGIPSGCTRTFQ